MHEVEAHMEATGLGFLLVTAYTGVAVAPFGGPTLMNMLSLGKYTKSVGTPSMLTDAKLDEARTKFHEVAGMHVNKLAAS